MIKHSFHIQIDEDTFHYSQFVTHLQYLLKRQGVLRQATSDHKLMFASMKEQFPQTYCCVEAIQHFLDTELNWQLDEEEELYLMLHVNATVLFMSIVKGLM